MKTRQMKKGCLSNLSNQEGESVYEKRTRGEKRRRRQRRRKEKKGDERIPVSFFHVRSVLLMDLASVSDIRFSADSEVG